MLNQLPRRLAGGVMRLRVSLRKVLPRRLHNVAGYAGRWMVRTLESASLSRSCGGVAVLGTQLSAIDGHVVMVNPDLAAGGAERQLVHLVKGLAGLDSFRPTVIALHVDEEERLRFFMPELERAGVEVAAPLPLAVACERLAARYGAGALDRLRRSLDWAPSDVLDMILRLACEFAERRPAVVHGWQDAAGIAAALAALATGVPRIIVSGRNRAAHRFTIYRPYMRDAYQFLVDRPQVCLTNNSIAGARDYAQWLGIDESRVAVIRNGVAGYAGEGAGARRIWRQRLGLSADETVIGGVFRFQLEKRPLLWLEVAARLARARPRARFVLFGAGTMEAGIRARAREIGLADRLIMPGVAEDGGAAIAAFDLLLLTSLEEGTPNVVLEAAAAGVPAVATDAGGTSEAIIVGVTGTVVVPATADIAGEADALAQACLFWLGDDAARAAAAREGPIFVRRVYGLDRVVAETVSLYRAHYEGGNATCSISIT